MSRKGKCPIGDCDEEGEDKPATTTAAAATVVVAAATASANCTGSRCKACWLKLCFEKFQINTNTKQTLVDKYYPLTQTGLCLRVVARSGVQLDSSQTRIGGVRREPLSLSS